jgi:hypothetical protein
LRPIPWQHHVALSIDSSVENVHFRTDWLDFKEIGFRAAGSALSDLAAEGAAPVGALVSIGLPAQGKDGNDPAADIMAGVATVMNNLHAKVLGGDLTRADKYIVDVCVVGTAERPVRRSGAREGDALWVTGYLGGASLHRATAHRPADVHAAPTATRVPNPALPPDAGSHHACDRHDRHLGWARRGMRNISLRRLWRGIEINLERIPCWRASKRWRRWRAAKSSVAGHHAADIPRRERIDIPRRHWCRAESDRNVPRGAGGCRGGVRLLDRNTAVPCLKGYDHFASPL